MSLTSEDIQAISQLLDTKLNEFESKMDTKFDVTKQDLIARMDNMEQSILNTCLGYTDEQNERIITKLDNLQSTVNTATRLKTIDNDVYNLVNKRIDSAIERIERLEKIS